MDQHKTDKIKIGLFAGTLALGTLVGGLFFLHPTESAREKRKLTPFPAASETDFLDGSFFSGIEAWYGDTYPGREFFTSAHHRLQSLWGTSRVESVDKKQGEDIPTDPDVGDIPDIPDVPEVPTDTDEPAGETVGGFLLMGDTAYEKYYFSQETSLQYAALIGKAQTVLGDGVQVYDLIVPLSYAVNLDEKTQAKYDFTDADAATEYMYRAIAKANAKVKTVPVLDALRAHKNEYLYFRTDHHWTQKGAYYAWCEFCRAAGITAPKLSEYTDVREFKGFLGTLYAECGEPAAMTKNPDTVEAYVPRGTNRLTFYDRSGNEQVYSTGIVQVRTDTIFQNAASKYNCFIMGDNPLSVIHNENVAADRVGTKLLLVKESFGNALAPFPVDSYEYVYVIDYRYYDGTLSSFVTEHGITEVLFVNNLVATGASPRLTELTRFIR